MKNIAIILALIVAFLCGYIANAKIYDYQQYQFELQGNIAEGAQE